MWLLYLIFTMQLICGCWIGSPVSEAVSHPIRHSLPQELESLYGSDMNGRCTSVSGANSDICNGTSVLNDGIIQTVSCVCDTKLQWAAQLFTMRRSGMDSIVVSFEVPQINHDRIELVVFNCPERGIYAPNVTVYIDLSSTFLPKRSGDNLGVKHTAKTLSKTSCYYLLKFCVDFSGSVSSRYFNLEFPYKNNSDFVFLGEVTFLNVVDQNEPCGPPELIRSTLPLPPLPTELTTSDSCEVNTTTDKLDSVGETCKDSQCVTVGVVSVIVTSLLVAIISVAIHIAVYQCVYKPKLRSAMHMGIIGAGSSGDVSRQCDVIYDVVNERVKTSLEMKQNEAYGLTRSR